jgi:hypothetical protein
MTIEPDTAREGLERFYVACDDALRAGVPLHALYRAITDAYEEWQDERKREAALHALEDVFGARPVNTDVIKPGVDPETDPGAATYNVGE